MYNFNYIYKHNNNFDLPLPDIFLNPLLIFASYNTCPCFHTDISLSPTAVDQEKIINAVIHQLCYSIQGQIQEFLIRGPTFDSETKKFLFFLHGLNKLGNIARKVNIKYFILGVPACNLVI